MDDSDAKASQQTDKRLLSEFMSQPQFLRALANSLRDKEDVTVLVPECSIRLRAIADIIELSQHIVKERVGAVDNELRD